MERIATTYSQRWFIVAQVAAVAIVGAALVLLPGAEPWSTGASLATVWGIVAVAYRLTSSRNMAGWWTLLIAMVLLSVGVVANTWAVTTAKGVTTANPLFDNNDMNRYFVEGLSYRGIYAGDPFEVVYRQGYGRLIHWIWLLTGCESMVPPLIVNVAPTLITIIAIGVITRRTLSGHTPWSDGRLQTAGMITSASIAFFFWSGTLLLREAIVTLSVVIMAIGALHLYQSRWAQGAVWLLVGAAIISFMRSPWVLLAFAGVASALRPNVKTIVACAALVLAIAGEWYLIDYALRNLYSAGTYLENGTNLAVAESFIYHTPSHAAFNRYFGEYYFSLPLWERPILVPIAAIAQYITPFPWAFTREITTAPTLALVKVTYMWYAVGGLLIYFYATQLRRAPSTVTRLAVWGLAYWLFTVYISGGTVARYGVPLVPLVVPAAVYVMASCLRCKSLRRWAIAYCSLMAVALIIAYNLT